MRKLSGPHAGGRVVLVLAELLLLAASGACAARAAVIHAEWDGVYFNLICMATDSSGACLKPEVPSPYWWQVAAGAFGVLAAAVPTLWLLRAGRPWSSVLVGALATGSLLGFTALAISSRWLMTNDGWVAWASASVVLGIGFALLTELGRVARELRGHCERRLAAA